jgi:hypothetical protein
MNLFRFFLCILPACFPAAAADQLTGFPFQNETLRYTIRWPSGVEMGEATVNATKADAAGWRFDMNFSAGVPGFPFADSYRSAVDAQLCSSELSRTMQHGVKKVTEKTTFDQQRRIAERKTLNPAGGGTSELQLPACAMDALAYHFLTRREMGQGRVPQPAKVFFGSGYDVRVQYTGAMEVTVGNKTETTDRVNVFIKGPSSDLTVEIYYARDAARTPVLAKIPATIGKISLELVRR